MYIKIIANSDDNIINRKEIMMKKEERKRTRVPVGFTATISAGERTIQVNTLNISLNGILCTPDSCFHAGDKCRVTLTLDPVIKVIIEGKILRITLSNMAISFSSMDEESFFHLKKIVEYNYGDADEINKEIIINKKAK